MSSTVRQTWITRIVFILLIIIATFTIQNEENQIRDSRTAINILLKQRHDACIVSFERAKIDSKTYHDLASEEEEYATTITPGSPQYTLRQDVHLRRINTYLTRAKASGALQICTAIPPEAISRLNALL